MATKIKFQKEILDWYQLNGRHDLPWRKTRDPYKILVSELMLQQTQVPRVIPKYKSFLKKFPTVKNLAAATQYAVLKEWQGLGYNRRALYLKQASEILVEKNKGVFPRTVRELEALPGIGPYTARAVCVFARNEQEIFIETNIRRVFLHFFFKGKTEVHDKEIISLIEKTMLLNNPREWYWALMDYGSLALRKTPNANRQSRHYTTQSKFEGSRRYARAKILQFLLEKRRVTSQSLAAFYNAHRMLHDYSLQSITSLLEQDGFISKSKNGWAVK